MEVARPVAMAPGPGLAGGFFTEADLEAADQLVHLSVSGGASPTSSSLSARSVNNTEAAAGREEYHDDGGVLDRRARKRYRRVAELYQATRPVDAGAGKRRREEISGNPSDRSAHWARCVFV